MKNAELIARLRVIAGKGMADYFNSGHPNSNAITEAADAIEKLQAEVERLNAKIDEHTKLCVKRVAEVTRERNIAQAQLAAAQGQSPDIAVGALYDFMGWLTTREKKLVLSSTDSAAPAADAIRDFTKMRNVSSESPLIKTWCAAPVPQQPSVPEGWKLVPIEPTELMVGVAKRIDWASPDIRGNVISQWQAMLAAAPQPKDMK